jgi:hypothetical protein
LFQLKIAAPGALFRGRCHEQFHVRIGADHRADIAAIENGPRFGAGKVSLIGEQRLAHLRVLGYERGRVAKARSPKIGVTERTRVERLGTRKGGIGIGRIPSACQGIARDGTVEGAGVEIGEGVMRGDAFCDRAFARGSRPVDRDDHCAAGFFSPLPRGRGEGG